MSGHSKWATTATEAAIDAKRGSSRASSRTLRLRLARAAAIPAGNLTLYDAIQKAKKNLSPPTTSIAPSSVAWCRGRWAPNHGTIMYEAAPTAQVFSWRSDRQPQPRRLHAPSRTAGCGSRSALRFGFHSVLPSRRRRGAWAAGRGRESIMMAVLDAGAEVEDAGDLFVIESDPKDVVAVRTAPAGGHIDYATQRSPVRRLHC